MSAINALTPGVDASKYQDDNNTPQQINWQKCAIAGARFAIIKASQGGFTDEDFVYNWRESKAAALLRSPYHFADYRTRADKQAEYLYSLVKQDMPELPAVLDVEKLWLPLPAGANMLAWIKDFFTAADALFGRKCIFYSNPDCILYWLRNIPDWLREHPLWIAHYGVSTPGFKPWQRWHFWQYTSTGDGYKHGMESRGLDMDWFNGSYDELLAFAGLKAQPVPVELPDAQKLQRLWQAHPELHS